MKSLVFACVLTLGLSVVAKEEKRKVASSVDDATIISNLIQKVSAFPKNKVTFKQKFKTLTEFSGCVKLSEAETKMVEDRMIANMADEDIKGTVSIPRSFGLLKCKAPDGDKIFTMVMLKDIQEEDQGFANALILSTTDYSANTNEIDADDLLGSDSLWLFHSANKSQKLSRLKVKVTKNAVKGARFDEFLSEKANVYFK